jgi:cytochrome c2
MRIEPMRRITRFVTIASLSALGFAPAVQASDPAAGRALFESDCANCHTLRKSEPQKRGPHLENLFARKYGAVEDFEYRMVWTTADPTWTPEELDAYLNIHGRYEKSGRVDLIDYLKTATKPGP